VKTQSGSGSGSLVRSFEYGNETSNTIKSGNKFWTAEELLFSHERLCPMDLIIRDYKPFHLIYKKVLKTFHLFNKSLQLTGNNF
jgi:hypothetical protein